MGYMVDDSPQVLYEPLIGEKPLLSAREVFPSRNLGQSREPTPGCAAVEGLDKKS